MTEITEAYVRERYGTELPQTNVDNLRKAMQKYGSNRWWESNDPVRIATFQIFEDILMVDSTKYHEGLEKIIGRPIFTHEMALNLEGLREETMIGLKRLKNGIGTSEGYKKTAIRKGIEMLENYCREEGKQLLKIDLSTEEPSKSE